MYQNQSAAKVNPVITSPHADSAKTCAIVSARSRLDDAVERLFKGLSILDERLSPVMAPASQCDGLPGDCAPAPSQLSEYIYLNASYLESMCLKVQSVLERLELP